MKSYRARALGALTNDAPMVLEGETASNDKPGLQGNRKSRRKQALFNKLLSRKMQKMSELGPIDVSIGPDGVPHVKVSKNKLLEASKKQLAEVKKNPEVLVHGPGMEGLGPQPLSPDLPCGCRLWDDPPVIRKGCELHDRWRDGPGPALRDLNEIAAEELAKLPVPERVNALLEGEINRQRALSDILDSLAGDADEC
jgi:hypothetical protein